jgi:hypothetical protein
LYSVHIINMVLLADNEIKYLFNHVGIKSFHHVYANTSSRLSMLDTLDWDFASTKSNHKEIHMEK